MQVNPLFLLASEFAYEIEKTPAQQIAQSLMWGTIAFFAILLIVSTIVVVECARKKYASAKLMAALLFGSIVIPQFYLILSALHFVRSETGETVMPVAGFLIWLGSLIGYTVVSASKRKQRLEAEENAEIRSNLGPRNSQPDDPTENRQGKAVALAQAPRQSAQTPSAGRIAAARVPGNPELPDGEVTISCMDCNAKMKAPGAKFKRCVACPKCKAAPFRFKV